jgi:hypothetical protein
MRYHLILENIGHPISAVAGLAQLNIVIKAAAEVEKRENGPWGHGDGVGRLQWAEAEEKVESGKP